MDVSTVMYRCGTDPEVGPTAQVSVTVTRSTPTFAVPTGGQTIASGALLVGPRTTQPTGIFIDGQGVRLTTVLASVGGRAPAKYDQVRTSLLAPGPHTMKRVRCHTTSYPSGCNMSTSTPPVTFTVGSVRPYIFSPPYWKQAFSPNGDGRRDDAKVDFVLDRPGRVTIRVTDPWRRTVRGPVQVAGGRVLAAGKHSWTWDGSGPSRRGLDGRTFLFDLRAASVVNGKTVTGSALGSRRIDLKPPTVGVARILNPVVWGSGSREPHVVYLFAKSGTVWPQRSSGANSFLQVRNGAGRLVLNRSLEERGHLAEWSPRSSGYKPAPPGRYLVSVMSEDWAGNRAESKRYAVTVR